MGKLKNGYVQIYTGNGKGKTTAAVGLQFVQLEMNTLYLWYSF